MPYEKWTSVGGSVSLFRNFAPQLALLKGYHARPQRQGPQEPHDARNTAWRLNHLAGRVGWRTYFALAYGAKLRRFDAEQPVCLVHGSNHL